MFFVCVRVNCGNIGQRFYGDDFVCVFFFLSGYCVFLVGLSLPERGRNRLPGILCVIVFVVSVRRCV